MKRIKHVLPNVPAAGADFSYTVPESVSQARVVSFISTLTSDATVANRVPALQITDRSGNVRLLAPGSVLHTASLAIFYVWGLVGSPYEGGGVVATGGSEIVPLIDCWVQGGDRIQTSTQNLQAGDVWSAPYLTLELDE